MMSSGQELRSYEPHICINMYGIYVRIYVYVSHISVYIFGEREKFRQRELLE